MPFYQGHQNIKMNLEPTISSEYMHDSILLMPLINDRRKRKNTFWSWTREPLNTMERKITYIML